MERPLVVNAMASLILVDFGMTVIDIDARATKQYEPIAAFWISEFCLLIYTLELLVNFWARRLAKEDTSMCIA